MDGVDTADGAVFLGDRSHVNWYDRLGVEVSHDRAAWWLPIVTTRGDRLFIGLLSGAYIHLAWLGLTNYPLWWATIIMLVWMVILMRWG